MSEYVRMRGPCPECNDGYGTGMVMSRAWREWWAEYDTAPPWRQAELANARPDEPEEVPCEKCNGTGWIEYWVPLAGLRQMLAKESVQ